MSSWNGVGSGVDSVSSWAGAGSGVDSVSSWNGAGTGGCCLGAGTGGHCLGVGTGGRSGSTDSRGRSGSADFRGCSGVAVGCLDSGEAGRHKGAADGRLVSTRARKLPRHRKIPSLQHNPVVSGRSMGWW